ncbi:uncharacterized protein [Halyomorpha halys]|uniref:uncharacterized protein isoform X1 n=1 Tax=Halyomorpha halys TaxID=286706 RepID=UPI0006D4F234|nr:uncharacterized protein LOC106688584 isoform X1 [Halyomorpha halys]
MYLAGVLVLALSAVVLISAHPLESQQDPQSVEPATVVREKRTIGILRDLFPNFSQIIDRKIQMLTRIIFRIVGRLVLQGGGGGGGGGGDDDDRKISIVLPTYPPDQLEDEDEDEDATATPVADSTDPTTNADSENSVNDNRKREVRSKRSPDDQAEEEEDLEPDATGDNEVPSDNEAESDGEAIDEEDPRNKRFLNFNLGASDAAGGSGGGSGNFLFDIVRKSADRAARMAGTVFRVLAGTDDAGLPSYNHQRSLVAGSGNSQGGDASHAALEEGKEEAVPGPLTRLFVVANKGVAALIQDLILRLAQTSERIVNFKAKLITSII